MPTLKLAQVPPNRQARSERVPKRQLVGYKAPESIDKSTNHQVYWQAARLNDCPKADSTQAYDIRAETGLSGYRRIVRRQTHIPASTLLHL